MTSAQVRITLNGSERTVAEGTRLSALLSQLEVAGRVAVEVNTEVVRRSRHADFVLKDGDRVEVVTFVGGG